MFRRLASPNSTPSRLGRFWSTAGSGPEGLEVWFDHASGPVYRTEVPGAEALAWWRTLREAVDSTGYWPVLLGTPEDSAMLDEMRTFDVFGPADLDPAGVASFDLAGWRGDRAASYGEWGEVPRGPWPASHETAVTDFTVDCDILTGRLVPTVTLALLPTTAGWEVPLILRSGGWNECPVPMVHAATLRDWHEEYGAELVALTGDVIEMTVSRPPADRDTAMALAEQQYLYCGDVVWQGTGTIEGLAAAVLDAPIWYFWWD
jgi:hypothetical protein